MNHRAKSFWMEISGDYAANEPVKGDVGVDVAVVGAGVTGLSAAWNIKERDKATSVYVLEAEVIGFGASGRNMGWLASRLSPDMKMLKIFYGKQRAREAFLYAQQAVEYSRQMLEEHAMDCDFVNSGMMTAAFGKGQLQELHSRRKFFESMGARLEWLDREAAQQEVNSPLIESAFIEEDAGLMNPCKLVREWKRIVETIGVEVYEETPVIDIERSGSKVILETPRGRVFADKVVLATNAYAHQLNGAVGEKLRHDTKTMFPNLMVTEPLTVDQWEEMRWKRKSAISDCLFAPHVARPFQDRVVLGYFYHNEIGRGQEINHDHNPVSKKFATEHFGHIFPALHDVKIEQSWGGPMSMTVDLVPHIGTMGDQRIIYSTGGWGHGLAVGLQNGRTISDLVLGRKTDLTDFWIVDRKPLRWPRGLLGDFSAAAFMGSSRLLDRRRLKRTPLKV